ncbi:hypothetical protein JCM8202_002946 [Rhodotorula sphaerocarpa]
MAGPYRGRRGQQRYHRQHELSNAYSALAAELTKTEIRSIGGYSLGRIIGEGTFGKVRLGVHRLTGTRVAIKQVPKSLPSYSPSDPSSPLSLLTREIHHHRRLRHPHVLSLFELVATESSIYLVTELCAGGELFDYLVEQVRLSVAETRRIFGQLVLGVAYLHGEGVVHRDLKLENVLLDENINVKIADLGFGREFEKGRFMETRVGTLGYMAPEVVSGQRYLGEEVDIWSLGVILYALLTGSLPFDDDDEGIMRQLILDCEYHIPDWLEEDAASLVRSILVRDPLQRASLKEILSHPFFTRPAPPSAAPSTPASPSTSTHRLTINSPGLGLSDSANGAPDFALERTDPGSRVFAPATTSSPPPPLMSDIQRGKQRASEPNLTTPPPPIGSGTGSSSRPSALPAHLATSPTPRLRRHPSTASIDFGPSAPAPSAQLFPPAMQRTSSAGAVSVSSLRMAVAGAGAAGGTAGNATGQRRRRSIGSVQSLRMHDLSEGEETAAIVAATAGKGPTPSEPGSRVASPKAPAAPSSTGSIEDDPEPVVEELRLPAAAELAADEGEDAERIDYVSLLQTTSAAPPLLSTPEEQSLMQQLTLLGFDEGQVAHSVRTSACDSCSAMWWMLRQKRDAAAERELETNPAFAAAGHERGESGEGKLSRTSSLRSVRRSTDRVRDPAAVLYDSPDDANSPPRISLPPQREDYLEILTEEQGPLSPLPSRQPLSSPDAAVEPMPGRARERAMSRGDPEPTIRLPSPPQTPPKRPSVAPVTPAATLTSPTTVVAPATPSAKPGAHDTDAEARLSFFLNSADLPTSAASASMLSYFPTVDTPPHPSPSSKRAGLSQSVSRDSLSVDAARTTAATGAGGDEQPDSPRRERARSGSASLLARATSAIGQSLASLAQGGTPEETEDDSTPRLGAAKLPSSPQRAMTSAPGQPPPEAPAQHTQYLRPPAVHAVSAPPSAPSRSPAVATSSLPRTPLLTVSSMPGSPGRPTSRASPSPVSAPSPRSSSQPSLRTDPSGGVSLGRSTSSASTSFSKKNKGGNLLNTFKHWFGQDPRKRKRASMSPRLGLNGEPAPGQGANMGRSHSMYGSVTPSRGSAPLAIAGRPQIGSRKSSYNSMYAGAPASAGSMTVSRPSSVSSVQRAAYAAEHGTPLCTVRSGRRRRLSDASRTSRTTLSERGEHSRPSSVRSMGGPGPRRHRHSTGASSSPSGSYVNAKEVYRRPPTTTTVRRRHGSRSRHSGELGGSGARHHRRTASGTSSMNRSSSGSLIAGAGSGDEDFVDEDDVGQDPIMEEDEDEGDRGAAGPAAEVVESAREAARSRALRTLSGDTGASSPALSSASTSVRSSLAASHHYPSTTFTAHKSTHLFGSPLQPHAPPATSTSSGPSALTSALSRRATVPAHPAPRRDVFAAKESNGDWVDEDDELSGYGGGLGQGNTAAPISPGATETALSGGAGANGASTAAGGGGPLHSPALPGYVDSPAASKIWGSGISGGGSSSSSSPMPISIGGGAGGGGSNGTFSAGSNTSGSSSAARFESRYAGLGGAGAGSLSGLGVPESNFANGASASTSPQPPKWAQAAPVIEEEEEE